MTKSAGIKRIRKESTKETRIKTSPSKKYTTKIICTNCRKQFSTKTNLKQHLPLHNETQMLFACTHHGCGKAYSRKSNLKVHVATAHDEISKYMCDYAGCNKKFKFNSSLKKHIAKHLNENPVQLTIPRRYVRPLASQITGYKILVLSCEGEA